MIRAVVIGAGERGLNAFGAWFERNPHAGVIVGVAEPDPVRRARFADRFGIDPERCFGGWDELFAVEPFADAAVVATGDRHHVEPTLGAVAQGYHVLLEKPMALDEAGCEAIAAAAERTDRIVQVAHVYRYSKLFAALHEVVASGELGRVLTIQLAENVAFWHYAHSYVRGHTRRSDVPMLLQKSCHDLDLLFWLAGAPAAEVTSLVRPTELTEANAPEGAPAFCIEGCPHAETCPYDAAAIYLDLDPVLADIAQHRRPFGIGVAAQVLRRARPALQRVPVPSLQKRLEWDRWPVGAVSDDASRAGLERALRETNWGRCVYRVPDNDQPAAQTVDVRFANDVLASFTMQASSHRSGREVRVDGSRGSAVGRLYALEQTLEVVDHKTGRRRRRRLPPTFDGHGGGEGPLIADFVAAVEGRRQPLTTARESVESHRIAFAAMQAAAEARTVRL